MGITTSIIVFAVGAILRFATSVQSSNFNVHTIGVILMIVGVVGFVISMIFGHAPIIVPAVLGRPLAFTRAFYLPLIVLHASVAIRLAGDMAEELGRLRPWGGLWNAIAIACFVIAIMRSLVLGSSGKRVP